MSSTKCAKCGGSAFSVEEHAVAGSSIVLAIVQCGNCKAPIGALDTETIMSKLSRLEAALTSIEQRTARIETMTRAIGQKLQG